MLRENLVEFPQAEVRFQMTPMTKDEVEVLNFYEALTAYNALIHHRNMLLIITPVNRLQWLRILQSYLRANSKSVSDFSDSPLNAELKPTTDAPPL